MEHLNVGGTAFSVDKEVLSRDPASMLAVMFGGRFSKKTDRSGRVFIDRDGERFRHVIDFLTDGTLHIVDTVEVQFPARRRVLPNAADRLILVRQLQAEAQYFNLQSMFDALTGVEQQLRQEILAYSLSESPLHVRTIKHPIDVWCVRMARKHGLVLTGDNDGRIRIWSIKTNALVQVLERHRSSVTCLDYAINQDGQITRLVSGSLDRSVRVWDIQSGACTRIFTDHESALHFVQLDGDYLVSSAGDGTVCLFDLQTATCIRMIRTSSNDVHVLMRGGIGIVTAGCAVWVWDMTGGQNSSLVCSMIDPRVGNILSVAWNGPDEDEIVTGTSESGICFWSLSRGVVVRTITESGAFAVNQVLFRNGFVFSCSFLPTCACIWDAQTGQLLRRLDSNSSGIGMLEMDIDDTFDGHDIDSSSPLICLASRFHSSSDIKLISFQPLHTSPPL